jgi:O-antigen ligase
MSQLKLFLKTYDHWMVSSREWILLLTFFTLPLSKSAPLILVFLFTVLWFLEPSKNKLIQLKTNKLCIILIIFYFIHPLSLLWSNDINFGIQRSLDYAWILLIAITISQYEGGKFRSYLSSFVAGASIHAMFFYLGYFDIFHILNSTIDDPAMSGNRNTYGPLIAIASISMIYLTTTGTWISFYKFSGLFLALLLLITVLLNTSRTGHAVLITLTLASIAYISVLKKKRLLGAVGIAVFLSTIFVSVQFSDGLQSRISQATNDIYLYETNPLTSTGIRISFYQNTIELQLERSFTEQVIGSGVGDYVNDFNAFIEKKQEILPGLRKSKEDAQGWNRFRDLHSQFLMNLLKFGYVGLFLIMALTILFYNQQKKNRDFIITGLFISVFLALIVNSLSQSAMETRGLAPTYFLILGIFFTNFHKNEKTHG